MAHLIPESIHLLHEILEKTRQSLAELARDKFGSEFDMPLIIDIESYPHDLGAREVPNFDLGVPASDLIDFDFETGMYTMNLLDFAYEIAPKINERIKEDIGENFDHPGEGNIQEDQSKRTIH